MKITKFNERLNNYTKRMKISFVHCSNRVQTLFRFRSKDCNLLDSKDFEFILNSVNKWYISVEKSTVLKR